MDRCCEKLQLDLDKLLSNSQRIRDSLERLRENDILSLDRSYFGSKKEDTVALFNESLSMEEELKKLNVWENPIDESVLDTKEKVKKCINLNFYSCLLIKNFEERKKTYLLREKLKVNSIMLEEKLKKYDNSKRGISEFSKNADIENKPQMCSKTWNYKLISSIMLTFFLLTLALRTFSWKLYTHSLEQER